MRVAQSHQFVLTGKDEESFRQFRTFLFEKAKENNVSVLNYKRAGYNISFTLVGEEEALRKVSDRVIAFEKNV